MSEQSILELYNVLHTSTQKLMNELGVSYLEALAETLQNISFDRQAQQVDGMPTQDIVDELTRLYHTLPKQLDSVTVRKAIQYAFLQAIQHDNIQANHHTTPETIANLIAYFIQQLTQGDLSLLDMCAGVGNLLTTVMHELSNRVVSATAVEFDEVLVSLLAMSAQLQQKDIVIKHQDSVLPLMVSSYNVVVSDLPIGYYPKDDVARDYQVSVSNEHTYAHHLLMENALQNLSNNGWGFFIVPANLFMTAQSPQLLTLLTKHNYYMQAFLTLPKTLFKQESAQKAILIVQKHGNRAQKSKSVLLAQVPSFKDANGMKRFIDEFNGWVKQF